MPQSEVSFWKEDEDKSQPTKPKFFKLQQKLPNYKLVEGHPDTIIQPTNVDQQIISHGSLVNREL